MISGLTLFISDIGTLNNYHYVQEFPVVKIPMIFVSVHINIDKEANSISDLYRVEYALGSHTASTMI